MPICNDVVEISVEETVEAVTIEVDCVIETVLVQIEETTDVVQIEIADVGLRGPQGPEGPAGPQGTSLLMVSELPGNNLTLEPDGLFVRQGWETTDW